jgi:hypothetical protein
MPVAKIEMEDMLRRALNRRREAYRRIAHERDEARRQRDALLAGQPMPIATPYVAEQSFEDGYVGSVQALADELFVTLTLEPHEPVVMLTAALHLFIEVGQEAVGYDDERLVDLLSTTLADLDKPETTASMPS